MANRAEPPDLASCFENNDNLQSSFECLVGELATDMDIGRASLSWIEEGNAIIAALWSRSETDLAVGLSIPIAGKLAAKAVSQRKALMDTSGTDNHPKSIFFPRAIHHGSIINVPLIHNDEVYALLTFHGGIERPYTEADRTRVEQAAAIINSSLVHLRLREKELERFAQLEREQHERLLFINSVAHELKTPLTAIMASGGLLQEMTTGGGSPQQQRRLVDNIMSAAARLDARLNELLTAARSEKVGFTLKFELVDLHFLLQTVASVVQPLLERKRQTLTLDLPERVPLVRGDRQRLEQVALNLLNNANKFTPAEGKIVLRLREEGSRLLVEIVDNGPGIPPEDQPNLFRPYYRREADRERYQGLGLGLAICRQLVEQHGGRIWLTSRPGEGSTFAFFIPLDGKGQNDGKTKPGDEA